MQNKGMANNVNPDQTVLLGDLFPQIYLPQYMYFGLLGQHGQ